LETSGINYLAGVVASSLSALASTNCQNRLFDTRPQI